MSEATLKNNCGRNAIIDGESLKDGEEQKITEFPTDISLHPAPGKDPTEFGYFELKNIDAVVTENGTYSIQLGIGKTRSRVLPMPV